MAGSRKPGPLGQNPEVQDLNAGTMIRGLSPLPGPVGVSLMTTHGSLTTAPAHTSGVDQLLQRLREASNGIDLQRVAVALLGPQCFSAGVIAGIGVDIIGSAADLLKLVGTLVLADLHDVRTGQVSWWRIVDPTIASRLLVAKLAGIAFEEELRKAAEERDALVGELTDALQDPQALFEGLAEGVAEGYKKQWQDFNAHLNAGTLERRFRGGMVLGQVLVDVLGLLTGIVGVGRAGAKVATKLPRLVQYARSVKLKPGIRGVPRSGGARGGGGGAPKAPPETQPAAKVARPSPPPAEPSTTKPRVPSKSPIKKELDELAAQGHGPQRHEGQVTDKQLDERARLKYDPETGTRTDKYTGTNHKCGDHATKINSEESYIAAQEHMRNSSDFKKQAAQGVSDIKVEAPLENIYGTDYKSHVSGRSRTAPWPDTTSPTQPTDFTDGKMAAIYRRDAAGNYNLVTMYPNPQ